MDSTILLLIGAFILGFLIALILGRVWGRSGRGELEAGLRQAQAAADSAKRDVTNLQSEVKVKQDYADTLNARIGTLEAQLEAAEHGRTAATASLARAQDDLKAVSADRPALEAELRDAQAKLEGVNAEVASLNEQVQAAQNEAADLRQQLDAAQSESNSLRGRVDAFEVEQAEREAAKLAALFAAAQLIDSDQNLTELGVTGAAAPESEVQTTLTAAPAEPAAPAPAPSPELEQALAAAQNDIQQWKDGMATFAFASAEIANAYEKRNKEYNELALRSTMAPVESREPREPVVVILDRQAQEQHPAAAAAAAAPEPAPETDERGLGPAAKMGLVAGGAKLAKDVIDEHAEHKAEQAGPSAEELTAQLEDLKKQYATLQADLQTESKSKSDLVSEMQTQLTASDELKQQLSAVGVDLDEVIGPQPEAPATEAGNGAAAPKPAGVLAKVALVKALVSGLKDKVQVQDTDLNNVTAALDNMIGPLPEGTPPPADLPARFALLNKNIEATKAVSADLQAKLDGSDAELNGLKATIADVTADVDALIGPPPAPADGAAAPDGAAPLDLKAKVGVVKTNLDGLTLAKTDLESKVQSLDAELGGLKGQIDSATTEIDGLIGPLPEGTPAPVDLLGRIALVKTGIDAAKGVQADLEGRLQASDAELNGVKTTLTGVSTDLDALGVAPADADLATKLTAAKTSYQGLVQAKADLEAQLQAKNDELAKATADLSSAQEQVKTLTADLDSTQAQVKALTEARQDLERQLEALNAQVADLRRSADDGSPLAKAAVAGVATVGATTIAKKIAGGGEKEGEAQAPQAAEAAEAAQTPPAEGGPQVMGLTAAGVTGAVTGAALAGAGQSAELQAKDAEIADLKARLDATTTVLQARDTDYSSLQSQFDEVAAANTKLPTLQQEIDALTISKAGLDAAVQEKEAALAEAQAKLAQLQSEVDSLTVSKAGLDTAVQEKEQALADAQAKLTELQASIDGLAAEKANIETSLNTRNAEFDALTAKLSGVRGELDTATTARGQLEQTLQARDAELNSLRDEVKRAREEGERSVAAEVAKIGVLTASAAAAASSIREKDEALAEAQSKIGALEQQLVAAQDQLNDAQARVQALQAENAEAASKDQALSAAQARIGELEQQVSALQGQLADAQAEADKLKAAGAATAGALAGAAAQSTLKAEPAAQSLTVDKTSAAEAARSSGNEPVVAACPQDLSEVKGIGSVFEQRLYAAGIGTYWELVNMSNDDFVRALQLNERQMLRMDFDEIRSDAQRLAHETGSVGRLWEAKEPDDFEPLEGIGRLYEKKLYDAGICTYEALAATTVEQLQEICPGTKLRTPDYADWIAQAKRLAAAKQ